MPLNKIRSEQIYLGLGGQEHQIPEFDLYNCILFSFIQNFPLPPALFFNFLFHKPIELCFLILRVLYRYLKKRSHEMDLAFDDMYANSHCSTSLKHLKNLKTGCVPYLGLKLIMDVIKSQIHS